MTMEYVKCPCGAEWADNYGGTIFSTLIGYSSDPGHDHDNNCKKVYYKCTNGHSYVFRKNRGPCPAASSKS